MANWMVVVTVLFFAQAREAANTDRFEASGSTIGAVLADTADSLGGSFKTVLENSNVWLNGNPADPTSVVSDGDEVAIIPPVSGG